MNSATISTRIDPETAKKLDDLAKVTNRTKSFLASEAIHQYVEEQSWQIDAIKQGLKEADEGKFASEKEAQKFFGKWNVDAD